MSTDQSLWVRAALVSRQLLWAVLLGECLLACIVVPFYSVHELYGIPVPVADAGLVGAALFATVVVGGLKWRIRALEIPQESLAWVPLCITAVGVVVRALWVVTIRPVQLSDFEDYWELARQLAATGSYRETIGGHVLYAFRPPGYSFFLAAWISVLGNNPWIPAFTNIAIYIASSLILFSITKRLFSRRAACWALLFFATWPSGVALTGLAATEPISLLLFLCAAWYAVAPQPLRMHDAILAGGAAGAAALIRPTYLALPALWLLYVAIAPRVERKLLTCVGVATATMVIVLGPWMIRNYRVLGAVIPVSTNGGDVFYRANNPLATGGWTGRDDLRGYLANEVSYNQVGYRLGMRWIRQQPVAFMRLAVRKQILFMEDDTTGVYWSLARGHNNWGPIYRAAGAASNLWWLAVWLLVTVALVRLRQNYFSDVNFAFLLAAILFLCIVHTVFESQGRYHMPMIGFLVMVAASSRTPDSPQASSGTR